MVVVRRAVDGDWERSRAIRLQALREAPLAFASTYQHEVGFGAEVWRQRIANSAQFLALTDGGEVIGTATGFDDREEPGTVLLVAMFVAPAARQHGVGELLVAAVVEHATASGARQVKLHVVENNHPAQRLYARCGFLDTGRTVRLPHSHHLLEQEMVLSLGTVVRSGS